MDSTISLQANFSYGLLPVILSGVIVFIPLLVLLAKKLKSKRKVGKKTIKKAAPEPNTKEAAMDLRDKTVWRLRELKKAFNKGAMDSKTCYQRMSIILREFVEEKEGVEVTTKTLDEIRCMNLPQLNELIAEYYEPEFSADHEGDAVQAIDKTIKVIKKWK